MKLSLSTESVARACARRPWLTVGVWIAALGVAFVLISMLLGGSLTNEIETTNTTESTLVDTLISDRLGASTHINEMIILRSSTLTVDDAEYRRQVDELTAGLMSLGSDIVIGSANYYMTGDETMVSPDRHSTLISLVMPRGADKDIEQVYEVAGGIAAQGTLEVFHTGDASFGHDTTILAEDTMKTGETVGILVALVVLAIVFGALIAATLPIILAIVAIVAALGLTSLVGQAMDLTFTITNIVTMMGLAVGIDYTLFILTRFREERERGLSKEDAIAVTGATASRAVLFSGITVLLALASLVIFPLTIFQSMGIGAIMVVFTAILAMLTLLPAVISLFGDRVNALRIPFIQHRKQKVDAETSGFWARTTRVVTRRPIISMALVVIVLGLATIPFFDKNTGMSGISGIPDDLRAKQGFMVLQEEFHLGMDAPAAVVIDGDVNDGNTQAAMAKLQQIIESDPAFSGAQIMVHPDKNLTIMYAGLVGDPMGKPAMDAVSRLRTDYIPEAFEGSAVKPLVGGQTAFILDFNQTTADYTPVVFGIVLSMSFIILLLAFRSVVIPATAILMNLLSVGAAYGLIVLVFQKGVGAALFGFQQVDVIETWLPLFLFALLFGLSMDYHVFLLSRIREKFMQTGDNTLAVASGLQSTGKLITGAALIMVAVFGGFALGDMAMFQQMGFGLAIAVLIDATLIRTVLVPATMKLLGKYNWYLPGWLKWIPNVSLGESQGVQDAPRIKRKVGHAIPVGVIAGREKVMPGVHRIEME